MDSYGESSKPVRARSGSGSPPSRLESSTRGPAMVSGTPPTDDTPMALSTPLGLRGPSVSGAKRLAPRMEKYVDPRTGRHAHAVAGASHSQHHHQPAAEAPVKIRSGHRRSNSWSSNEEKKRIKSPSPVRSARVRSGSPRHQRHSPSLSEQDMLYLSGQGVRAPSPGVRAPSPVSLGVPRTSYTGGHRRSPSPALNHPQGEDLATLSARAKVQKTIDEFWPELDNIHRLSESIDLKAGVPLDGRKPGDRKQVRVGTPLGMSPKQTTITTTSSVISASPKQREFFLAPPAGVYRPDAKVKTTQEADKKVFIEAAVAKPPTIRPSAFFSSCH